MNDARKTRAWSAWAEAWGFGSEAALAAASTWSSWWAGRPGEGTNPKSSKPLRGGSRAIARRRPSSRRERGAA